VRFKRPAKILSKGPALVNGYRKKLRSATPNHAMLLLGALSCRWLLAHSATEAVVAVFETRCDAAASGHASDLDLMPPGTPA
jgi:hypothetical protein